MTRYDADFSEADIDVHTDEMNPEIPERDGADASAGHDTFVAHQWAEKKPQLSEYAHLVIILM